MRGVIMEVTAINTDNSAADTTGLSCADERARDYRRVERALQWLAENAERQPSLEESADAAGLSPFHFQRIFSRWAGVSPKQFLQYMSLERAKKRLAEGASVLEASMDAGLSGPSRLHDAFVSVESVTPGEYKRGLAGTRVAYGYHPTPFGDCVALTTARGLCGLGFVGDGDRDAAFQDLARRFPNATFQERTGDTAAVVRQVFAAADGPADAPLRVLLHGTPFQVQVWRALLEIPRGGHACYGDLAARIGSPGAARAVGAAVGANPISYLIPCHRVIRKTGALGGYHWGEGRKLAILGMEVLAAEA
jgi:AraC family transcriptional regulator of adaptative response/methylated-DNA-[protein]-cysteine methyltransferase